MKSLLRFAICLVPLVPAFSKPAGDLQARLETFVKGTSGGAAIAWIDADGVAFFNAGQFDSTNPRAITADTQFELGSISKVFTALLLAESERLGKISRGDPAAKYLLPASDSDQPALAKITLLTLATHTSGLPRLPTNLGKSYDLNDPYANYDRTALVEGLREDGPNAPVGRAMAYSNFGVSVLGEALAAAWGTTYTEALRAHVLDPLGLKATSIGLAGLPANPDLAPGHTNGQSVPNWTWQACAACGAVRSSSRDMAAFLTACLAKDPATPLRAAIEASLEPQHAAEDTGGKIALGWLLNGNSEHTVAWHNGATAGSHAFVGFSRKSGTGIVILANFQKPSETFGFALLGADAPKPELSTVKDPSNYVGHYPLAPSFAIDITETKGTLYAQATNQPKLPLRESGDDRFALVGVPAEISFERDSAGNVVALVLHQNGADQRAPRGDRPPPPKEIILSPEALREYVGSYPLAPTFTLTVSEGSGALFVQATGQSKLPVFASAKDEFFYKVVDAQLSFQRDAEGKVSGLILHQGGHNTPGKKAQ